MFIEKDIGLRLAIYALINAAQGDMQFPWPTFRTKKQTATTLPAKSSLSAGGGLKPVQLYVSGKTDLFVLKANPGYISGTMCLSAHTTMAMRTPFAGQEYGKCDCPAETTAVYCCRRHRLLNNYPAQSYPYGKKDEVTEYENGEAMHDLVIGDMNKAVQIP